jgi:adenylate cyclase
MDMAEERAQRRLAAILAADVVGYSRLMAADESGTLACFKLLRGNHFEPAIKTNGGRVVGEAGDSLLVEFNTATEAVACAIEVQEKIAEYNSELPENQRMRFRIGVNLGEVVVDGATIHGDGVNIAARLEKLAEPGGIVIARGVHEHIRGKVSCSFEDLGEKTLHNIAEPVRAYRLALPSQEGAPRSAWPVGEPVLALPSKPSIAVLPFVNMSGDIEQEYFSDGMTEDLITALSKIHWFFVIARTSTFAYKGRAVAASELGRHLGIRYVLEGSVRKGGNRVRISAQLVDAATGHHIWAERYDRNLEDIFALQDEMIETIVRAIEPELGRAEQERARRKPPGSLDAWELFQRGLWHHYRFTKDDNAEAERCFLQAIKFDPTFALPFAALAHACYWNVLFGYAAETKKTLAEGLELAQKAVSLDGREPFAHFELGRVQALSREFDAAIAELEHAIELNPNFAHAYYGLGTALIWAGQPARALDRIDAAIRLNPRDPAIWTFQAGRALALFLLDRLDEAADWAHRSTRSISTGLWSHGIEAAVLAHLGRRREAAAALAQVYRLKPNFSAEFVREVFPFKVADHRERFLDGLHKAGLSE